MTRLLLDSDAREKERALRGRKAPLKLCCCCCWATVCAADEANGDAAAVTGRPCPGRSGTGAIRAARVGGSCCTRWCGSKDC